MVDVTNHALIHVCMTYIMEPNSHYTSLDDPEDDNLYVAHSTTIYKTKDETDPLDKEVERIELAGSRAQSEHRRAQMVEPVLSKEK